MSAKIMRSEGFIHAEDGHISVEQGYLRNVTIQNNLILDVKETLELTDSSIGGTLTINSGTVELKNVVAQHLVINENAIIHIDHATCSISNITRGSIAPAAN